MAKIVASIKLFPEDIIADMEKMKMAIRQAIPVTSSIHKVEEEPIAFGIVALIVHVISPEVDGEIERVEDALRKVKGISEVETLLVRRI